jgi:hypothetical protein
LQADLAFDQMIFKLNQSIFAHYKTVAAGCVWPAHTSGGLRKEREEYIQASVHITVCGRVGLQNALG